MAVLFEPEIETADGWRETFLGLIACRFGWHFGQIGIMNQRLCARCKMAYTPSESGGVLVGVRYFLPRRTRLLILMQDSDAPIDLRTSFNGYACMDCPANFISAQSMLDHQQEWHGWRKAWRRLKDS